MATENKLITFATAKQMLNDLESEIAATGRTAINSWQGVQAIVRAGLASKVFSVGDQLTCQRDGVDLVWDVIDIDHDTPADPQYIHSLTLQMHDIYKEIQLDAREAFYYAEYGLPAGTYHFLIEEHTWVNSDRGKTVQFTLTDAIPPGGQLVFNQNYNASVIGATLSSYDSATDTRARETVTLIEGDGGTPLGDGKINRTKQTSINSLHRALLGNNNYNESAIRQFLNSNATSGSVWAPQNIWDRPPQWVTGANGFMYGMDADVLAVVGNVTKLTANNLLDGTGTITTTEKFFLPSKEELYAGRENPDFSEGGCYSYYKNYSCIKSLIL